jgi:SAM-dependent methyltransferase
MDLSGDWSVRLRQLFDEYGEREWQRLDADARSRASFEIHRRFLARFISGGMRVLEIGAGPGRFTIELARLGGRVVVTDISPAQLALNEEQVRRAGFASDVEERRQLDVCNLSDLADGEFDAVVAYGGPLSYAFERAEDSLAEMLRVTGPGGVVVASVMALVGTLRFFLPGVPQYAAEGRLHVLQQVVASGDNRYDTSAHPCRLFRWREVHDIVRRLPCTLIGASASNFLTCGDQEVVEAMAADPLLWTTLLDWEEQMCGEPGGLDGGTHLLFALRNH